MDKVLKPTTPPLMRFDARLGWPFAAPDRGSGLGVEAGALRLSRQAAPPIPLTEPMGSFGGATLPRGLAISSEGRVFLADPRRRVILTARLDEIAAERPVTAPETWPFAPLWAARPWPPEAAPHDLAPPSERPADPYTLLGPTDVALSPAGDLVILDPPAARLLVLAFPTAHLRHVIEIPGGAPTAIAFDRQGRALVADPGLGTLHRFNAEWRPDAGYPHPSTAFETPEFIATALDETDRCGCAGDGGETCDCGCAGTSDLRPGSHPPGRPAVWVIDGARLVGLDAGGRVVAEDPQTAPRLTPPALIREGDALLYQDPGLPRRDRLRIAGLEVDPSGRHAGTGLPILARARRVGIPRRGELVSEAIDSERVGFAWDRIGFDLALPPNTRLQIQTLTADSFIAPDRIAEQPDNLWARPLELTGDQAPEILVQSRQGRYLWLRLRFFGDGKLTPVLRRIDLHGPRRSSLTRLPPVFREDPESAWFLDRFLSYFDTVHAEITSANDRIAALFDPEVTPEGAFLDWLGGWFDLDFLAEWDTALRREMVAGAMRYYRMRGTVAGLRRFLQWHTGLPDPLPQVIEHFRLRDAEAPPMLGGAEVETGTPAHSFTIVLPAAVVPDAAAEARLDRLIRAQVPAHARYHLRLFDAGIRIGSQSSIGVDTLVGSLRPGPLGEGRLGEGFSTSGPPARSALRDQGHSSERGLPC